MKVKQLLGRHDLPNWFRNTTFVIAGLSIAHVLLVLAFGKPFFPKWVMDMTVYIGVGSVLLYLALKWPGMALAVPFILIPNLIHQQNGDALFLWCVVVPLTAIGILIIVWTGRNFERK